jgi:ribonuclease HI
MLWEYFDGASQWDSPRWGVGGVLHLSSDHYVYSTFIVNETKNYCELMALKLNLCLAREKGISHLHIYGDSIMVI